MLPGSYKKDGDLDDQVSPTLCPSGWFQDLDREDKCKMCERGRYQDVEGGSGCKLW